ncbi:MAG: hypothetical protein IPM34_08760 [Saprospiraceae bacterium]|nr:hypothetical protein [Saprospiraceae bacterium]
MNLKNLLYLFVCTSILSCKDSKTPGNEASVENTESAVEEVKLPPAAMNKPDEKFINASKTQKINDQITGSIWHYVFGLSIKDPTPKDNVFEGQWIYLLKDGTFKQGMYQDTTDSGYFLFTDTEQDDLLELRSDKAASEWKVKMDAIHLLLVGTSKYGNNPWQIKLRKSDGLPEKKE